MKKRILEALCCTSNSYASLDERVSVLEGGGASGDFLEVDENGNVVKPGSSNTLTGTAYGSQPTGNTLLSVGASVYSLNPGNNYVVGGTLSAPHTLGTSLLPVQNCYVSGYHNHVFADAVSAHGAGIRAFNSSARYWNSHGDGNNGTIQNFEQTLSSQFSPHAIGANEILLPSWTVMRFSEPLAITGVNSTDVITTASPHGLSVNDTVCFPTMSTAGNITQGKPHAYYVKTVPSSTTLTISATQGGATFDLGADIVGYISHKCLPHLYLRSQHNYVIHYTVQASPVPGFGGGWAQWDFTVYAGLWAPTSDGGLPVVMSIVETLAVGSGSGGSIPSGWSYTITPQAVPRGGILKLSVDCPSLYTKVTTINGFLIANEMYATSI